MPKTVSQVKMLRRVAEASPPADESPVDRARRRFGQKFAHEPGSKWRPHSEFYLTRWLKGEIK